MKNVRFSEMTYIIKNHVVVLTLPFPHSSPDSIIDLD